MENDGGVLLGQGKGTLTTTDCVAQSMAVGPIFSAAVIGFLLASFAGGVGPFVVILTTVGILGLGYVISEFAKRYSGAGAVYEFLAHSVGKRAAIFGAAAYFLAYAFLVGGLPMAFGSTAVPFWATEFHQNVPWWVFGVVLIAIVTVINVLGITFSVRAQLTAVALSIIPFIILSIVVISKGGVSGNHFSVFEPNHIAAGGSVFKGLLFAILMFVGFELAAVLGEETAKPKRSIPIAIFTVILITAVIYVVTQYVGTIGSGGPGKIPFDFQAIATHFVGSWLSALIGIAIMLDIIGIAIGFSAACARGLYALSRDQLLPKAFTKVSSRRVPIVGTLSISALMVILMVLAGLIWNWSNSTTNVNVPFDGFWMFLIASAFGSFLISLIYAILCIAAIKMFMDEGSLGRGAIPAILGFAISAGGIAAQFINGLAPAGTALQGRNLALYGIAIILVWLVYNVVRHPEAVDAAGNHALQHQLTETGI
jgi:amino acid transporter